MVNFSNKQLKAIDRIVEVLSSKGPQRITLTGSAGTGKSCITAEIVQRLRSKRVPLTLCAPTNKAKVILGDFTDSEVSTIHSLLKLKPQIDIANLDYSALNFMFPDLQIIHTVLIVDEASMVNDDLYQFLCEKYEKILAIGDIKQLVPVGQKTFSKFFTDNETIELTEVFRQQEDSPLIDVLLTLRDKVVPTFVTNYNEKGGIIVYDKPKEFLKEALKEISKDMDENIPPKVAVLTYTNKMVDAYNNVLRRALFPLETDALVPGDKLLARDGFEAGFTKIINSMDYRVLNSTKLEGFYIGFGLPRVTVYEVTLSDFEDDDIKLFILSPSDNSEDVKYKIAMKLEALRSKAIGYRKGTKASREAWANYFRFIKLFATMEDMIIEGRVVKKATFKYGYARSVHISQGCSLDTVFMDNKDIQLCRSEIERRQLQYVAASRTRKFVHVIQ